MKGKALPFPRLARKISSLIQVPYLEWKGVLSRTEGGYVHLQKPTFQDKARIADRVDDGLRGDNSCDITMENVESPEIPAREPEEDIISTGEEPKKGQICYGEESGTVGDVGPGLFLCGRPTG